MTLVRGTAATAQLKLFEYCDPLGGGPHTRRCGTVPRVSRLFIGYGSFALPRLINRTRKRSTWAAWLDGHPIQLSLFGTSDQTLFAFPPAGGRDVTLREWRVMLVNPSPGRHTLRYRVRATAGVGDTTWIITVTRR